MSNLEMQAFMINSALRSNNQKPFTPRDGLTMADVDAAWQRLERAEHEREMALRDALIACVIINSILKFFSKYINLSVFAMYFVDSSDSSNSQPASSGRLICARHGSSRTRSWYRRRISAQTSRQSKPPRKSMRPSKPTFVRTRSACTP